MVCVDACTHIHKVWVTTEPEETVVHASSYMRKTSSNLPNTALRSNCLASGLFGLGHVALR